MRLLHFLADRSAYFIVGAVLGLLLAIPVLIWLNDMHPGWILGGGSAIGGIIAVLLGEQGITALFNLLRGWP